MTTFADQNELSIPNDLDAERCVIASAAIDEQIRAQILATITPADFYSTDHQIIFGAICDMHRRGQPIDIVLIRGELERRHLLGDVGGSTHLGQILNALPSAAHGEHYAARVKDCAILRAVISAGHEMIRLATAPSRDPRGAELALSISSKLLALAADGGNKEPISLGQAVAELVEHLEDPQPTRITTGLTHLDTLVGGVPMGGFTIIAGEPGMGKSQLIKQIAHNAAATGVRCGIVTIEENRRKIAGNYLSSATKIPNNRIAYRKLTADDWQKVPRGIIEADKLRIWIQDASFSLPEIEAAVQHLHAKYGCTLIAIDHLHLIDIDGERTREREVSKISSGLKRLFRRLNVAGVAAAQLNRSHDRGSRPELRSLRDSGTLEADGDLICLLYREDYHRMREPGYIPNKVLECAVAKNKDGPQGTARLHFDASTQTVSDLTIADEYAAQFGAAA